MESNRFLWNCPLYCSWPISRIDVEMTTTYPSEKPSNIKPSPNHVCAMIEPYFDENASSNGLSGSLRSYNSKLLPPMFMERCVSESSEAASRFWVANCMSMGACLSSVCSSVSPDSLDSVKVRSSDPRASLLVCADQQPHVIFFGCFPSTETFFLVRRSYTNMFPFLLPTTS